MWGTKKEMVKSEQSRRPKGGHPEHIEDKLPVETAAEALSPFKNSRKISAIHHANSSYGLGDDSSGEGVSAGSSTSGPELPPWVPPGLAVARRADNSVLPRSAMATEPSLTVGGEFQIILVNGFASGSIGK